LQADGLWLIYALQIQAVVSFAGTAAFFIGLNLLSRKERIMRKRRKKKKNRLSQRKCYTETLIFEISRRKKWL